MSKALVQAAIKSVGRVWNQTNISLEDDNVCFLNFTRDDESLLMRIHYFEANDELLIYSRLESIDASAPVCMPYCMARNYHTTLGSRLSYSADDETGGIILQDKFSARDITPGILLNKMLAFTREAFETISKLNTINSNEQVREA